jgi:hypothetical protein
MFLGSLSRGRRSAPIVVQSNGTPLNGVSAWFTAPSSAPSLNQSGMDSFNPTTTDTTPNSSAPIISRISNRARPGGVVNVTGYQFDDTMQLWIYSEANGTGNLLQATLIPGSRIGNKAKYQIHSSSVANSFMLAWLYHPIYGWSYPYPINNPICETLHTSFYGSGSRLTQTKIVARNGQSDQIRIGGKSLSQLKSPEKCWCYLQPTGGGAGTWIASDSANFARALFTLPVGLANGDYEVWVHTGRGGAWGWGKSLYTLTVENADTLVADKIAPPPSGGDDSAALQAVVNSIPGNSGAYVQLQSGTYLIGTPINVARGSNLCGHFRGQPDGSTILKATGNNAFFSNNNFHWIEDINFDITNWTDAITNSTVTGAARRVINCDVTATDGAFTTFQHGGQATGAARVSGCTFRTAICAYGVMSLLTGWVSDTTLINNNSAEGSIYRNGAIGNIALDNVTGSDAGYATGGGRFVVVEYGSYGLSVVGCTTVNLKVSADQNRGEQILVDGGFIRYAFYANGGTSTTVTIPPTVGTMHNLTTSGSSSNATSNPSTLAFTNAAVISHVDIISGTNTIPGRYAVSSRTSSSATLTGAIGTTASLSNVTAAGIRVYGTLKTLSSTNANSSTPTVTGGSFVSGDVGTYLLFAGDGGASATWAKIASVSAPNATLDRAISGSATVTSATVYQFVNPNPGTAGGWGDLSLAVVGGKGEGQIAKVLSSAVVGTDLVLTLDRPFRVSTDSTSFIKLGYGYIDGTFWGNTLAGDGGQVTANSGASCGFQSFGPTANVTFRNNTVSGVHYGFADLPVTSSGGDQGPWSWWGDISNNTYTNCGFGTRIWSITADYGQIGVIALSIHEDITVSGTSDKTSPFRTGQFWLSGWDSPSETTLSNYQASGDSAYAFSTQQSTGGNVYAVASSIAIGSGTFSGSRVITSGSPITINQYNPSSGQFTGFQS